MCTTEALAPNKFSFFCYIFHLNGLFFFFFHQKCAKKDCLKFSEDTITLHQTVFNPKPFFDLLDLLQRDKSEKMVTG